MNKRSGIETKKRIFEAAINVFSRKGYSATNIREIAKAAGISVGAVYIYFKNKEELYQSLIEDKKQELSARIGAMSTGDKSAVESLEHFIGTHLEHAVRHKEFILLHIREHGFSFGIEKKRAFFNQQTKVVEKIIRRGIRAGEFRKTDAADAARIVMGTLRGIILTIALDNVDIKPGDLSDFILCALIRSRSGKNK